MTAPASRGPGKDPRIVTFRGTLESLIDSLDATVRIARWQGDAGEAIPEPLQRSAEQLQTRLSSANRLASGKFVGAPAVVLKSEAIKEAIGQLDAAFVAYRKRLDGPTGDHAEAAVVLDTVLGQVKADAHRWE
jgi:hypothetical protein